MKTASNIESIITNAKIIYSYRVQLSQIERQQGLDEYGYNEFMLVNNIFKAVEVSTLLEKNVLCDVLIRKGYTQQTNNLLFTENIYNTNFDKI